VALPFVLTKSPDAWYGTGLVLLFLTFFEILGKLKRKERDKSVMSSCGVLSRAWQCTKGWRFLHDRALELM
jgi:hypothetical protein